MGITSSLVTALSGLSTSQTQIDVVGNNIANVNTIGYKSSRLDFKTQFLDNFSYGSAPTGNLGGTNPLQIGLGATAGAVSKDFGDGSLQATGVPSNLAIQGNGFFVLKQGTQQVYTRDGSFQLNGLNQLVSSSGQLVQGYAVDANYKIIPGVLSNLTIPIGTVNVAQATTSSTISGDLNTNGAMPTTVSDLTMSAPLYLTDGAGGVDATNPPTASTFLTDLTDSTGAGQFQVGDVISLSAKKGSRSVQTQTLTVSSTTSLGDLESFMQGSLGINTTAGANGSIATTPGVTLATTANNVTLTIDGNPGTENDITMDANSLTVKRGATSLSPFSWNKNATADGESVTTSMTAYDSLGSPITVNIVATLATKSASGSTWTFYADSPDGTATGAATQTTAGMGTLTFDTSGNLVSTTNPTITVDRTNSGAISNLSFKLDFSSTNALSGSSSQIASTNQDGFPPGVLTTYSIGADGSIMGSFSNGLNRTVGQVALATFQNNEGLVDQGNNTYTAGPNSGTAIITTPESLSAGKLVAGSLEGSNVDLSSEFVQLIAASTAFSASSRVISSSNQLLQDLLSAAR